MELHEANKILRAVKTAFAADGCKVSDSSETDGLMMLLGKLDADKILLPKLKHARAMAPGSAAYEKLFTSIVFFRALLAVKNGIADPVTAMSVMLLHRSLYGELDPEAGKPRAKEVLTDGSAHTDPKYIPGSLKSIITKMNDIGSAPEYSRDDFAGYLSHYMRELLILHPFERGSEFTMRIFIMMFCKLKGFGMGYHRTTPAVIRATEVAAFAADDVTPLYKLILSCLSYEQKTVRPQSQTVKTRRELSQNLCNPARPQQAQVPPAEQAPPTPRVAPPPPAKTALSQDEILRRAVRLQQKITKLNEQLNELIQPLETNDDDT